MPAAGPEIPQRVMKCETGAAGPVRWSDSSVRHRAPPYMRTLIFIRDTPDFCVGNERRGEARNEGEVREKGGKRQHAAGLLRRRLTWLGKSCRSQKRKGKSDVPRAFLLPAFLFA